MKKHCFVYGEPEKCLVEEQKSCNLYDGEAAKDCIYWHECDLGECEARVDEAIKIIAEHAFDEDVGRRAWVIDQVARVLAGDRYDEVVREAPGGGGALWDLGVAP